MSALADLRGRLAELSDLAALGRLAAWDQRTMMPPEGAASRAHQLATITRLAHDLETADEVGAWLEDIEVDSLDEIDRDVVRVARRDWDRARRVPRELAGELAEAGAEGQQAWQAARAASDFAAFAPALRRNVALARDYAACFEGFARPYDALLADYDFGLTAERITAIFAPLIDELPGLIPSSAVEPLDVPVAAQEAAVRGALARVGVVDDSWRVDVSAHPFTSWVGPRDTRLTTRYEDGQLESVLAALHEFGHGLYERQIDPALARTNLGSGTSMSVHESQSKLWENHIARHPAFAHVIALELGEGGFAVTAEEVYAALTAVRPSLIRVSADPLT